MTHRQPTPFGRAIPRRWAIIAVAAGILVFSTMDRGTPTPTLLVALLLAATGINLLAWLVSRTDTRHPIFSVASFAIDVAIAAGTIAMVGAGGVLIGLLAVLLPYSLRARSFEASAQTLFAAASYVAAVWAHNTFIANLTDRLTGIRTSIVIDVAMFVLVSAALWIATSRTSGRIRAVRLILPQTDDSPAGSVFEEIDLLDDSVAILRRSAGLAVAAAIAHTREVTECVAKVRAATEKMAGVNTAIVGTSIHIADGLDVLRRGAEAGERRGVAAIEYARELGDKADTAAKAVDALLQHSESARREIQRSQEALRSIAHDAASTLRAIETMKDLATTAYENLQETLGTARQAHVLALNTAIKSANGEISQRSSGEVAARFRQLAADASGSTRTAVQLVDEMNEVAAGAARAVRAGQEQAREASTLAETATRVLQELHLAALRGSELISTSVDVTRIQAEHLAELSKHLADAAAHRIDTTSHVESTMQAHATNRDVMAELELAVHQLTTTTDQLLSQLAPLRDYDESSRNGDRSVSG